MALRLGPSWIPPQKKSTAESRAWRDVAGWLSELSELLARGSGAGSYGVQCAALRGLLRAAWRWKVQDAFFDAFCQDLVGNALFEGGRAVALASAAARHATHVERLLAAASAGGWRRWACEGAGRGGRKVHRWSRCAIG